MGAVDILIVWENLEISRLQLKNHQTDGKLRHLVVCWQQQMFEQLPRIVDFPILMFSLAKMV